MAEADATTTITFERWKYAEEHAGHLSQTRLVRLEREPGAWNEDGYWERRFVVTDLGPLPEGEHLPGTFRGNVDPDWVDPDDEKTDDEEAETASDEAPGEVPETRAWDFEDPDIPAGEYLVGALQGHWTVDEESQASATGMVLAEVFMAAGMSAEEAVDQVERYMSRGVTVSLTAEGLSFAFGEEEGTDGDPV